MAKEYDNTNSGALFKVEDKETDNHPDYRGEINAGGIDYWLSGWIKTSKKGTKFISFKLKPKEVKKVAADKAAEPIPFNDEIPF
jgi:uncharacterized protein (DUF736 family)